MHLTLKLVKNKILQLVLVIQGHGTFMHSFGRSSYIFSDKESSQNELVITLVALPLAYSCKVIIQ